MTIRELRETTGLSQSNFAKKFGINLRTLQHWDEGTRTPSKHIIVMITTILNYEKILKELGYETSSDKGKATTE